MSSLGAQAAPATSGYRPLVKWPGGKAREWTEIAPHLPEHVRHFADPFMGGLAPFARTAFAGRAFLNDRHPRLVDLHRRVQAGDGALLKALAHHGAIWQDLAAAASEIGPTFAAEVQAARDGARPDRERLGAAAARAIHNAGAGDATLPFVADSLADKAGRVARLERKHDVHFDADAVLVHGETAVRAGYYYRVRSREHGADGAQASADFWFVREYCYGSMFRVNAKGEFNIPYGGSSYNRKSFLDRLEQAIAPATRDALARAAFTCGDFEPFLDATARDLGPDDLVFVDPPYHSDFSTYGPELVLPRRPPPPRRGARRAAHTVGARHQGDAGGPCDLRRRRHRRRGRPRVRQAVRLQRPRQERAQHAAPRHPAARLTGTADGLPRRSTAPRAGPSSRGTSR